MRLLTELEMEAVAGGSADIIVLGIRNQRQDGGGSGGLSHYNYYDYHPIYGGGGSSAGAAPPSSVVAPSEYTVAAGVKVHVDDPAHLNEAIDAATRVADALVDLQEKITANPAASFSYEGHVYTATQMQSIIQNTQWIVDDAKTYNNNGVGGAGNGVDHLNYHAFSGSAFSNQSYGSDSYNGQGVEAMLLHEIGHMTDAGRAVHSDEMYWNRRDGGKDSTYYSGTIYGDAEEAWAHGFESSAAAGLGVAVDTYENIVSTAHQYGTYKSGDRIYANRHPGSPNV